MTTEELLKERGKVNGDFADLAVFSQQLKTFIRAAANAKNLRFTAVQIEALEMITHKIGRILAGDPNHKDHWDDIAGYATLVSKALDKSATQKQVT